MAGIPIRTTSWRFAHLVAMDKTPSSPICSFLSFLQELAMVDTPSSVQSKALLRYRTLRLGQAAMLGYPTSIVEGVGNEFISVRENLIS